MKTETERKRASTSWFTHHAAKKAKGRPAQKQYVQFSSQSPTWVGQSQVSEHHCCLAECAIAGRWNRVQSQDS